MKDKEYRVGSHLRLTWGSWRSCWHRNDHRWIMLIMRRLRGQCGDYEIRVRIMRILWGSWNHVEIIRNMRKITRICGDHENHVLIVSFLEHQKGIIRIMLGRYGSREMIKNTCETTVIIWRIMKSYLPHIGIMRIIREPWRSQEDNEHMMNMRPCEDQL